jgi:hypothetical protein
MTKSQGLAPGCDLSAICLAFDGAGFWQEKGYHGVQAVNQCEKTLA